ncbi:hypothetical protein RF11_06622 [Thelohanellus kitauei]|uniref:Uncharacterized protein n=1 Tax=Thelohanellus kitauei TaxID=669202 RepID=A0A0C2N4X7_THEKT|nr:hypothetical protein RF11_06622 [Thelohanellus kitauei]
MHPLPIYDLTHLAFSFDTPSLALTDGAHEWELSIWALFLRSLIIYFRNVRFVPHLFGGIFIAVSDWAVSGAHEEVLYYVDSVSLKPDLANAFLSYLFFGNMLFTGSGSISDGLIFNRPPRTSPFKSPARSQ